MKPKYRLHCFLCLAIFFFIEAMGGRAAIIVWTNAFAGSWDVSANWSPNNVPGPGDDAFIYGSSVTYNNSSGVGGLYLYGGNLNITGNLTINSSLDMYGGALTINGGSLVNNGRTTLNAGTFQFYNGGSLINSASGVFNIAYDATISYGTFVVPSIINAGLFDKTGGTNVAAIFATVTNSGTIKSDSGNLALSGGGRSIGSFYISRGATISVPQGILNLTNATVSGPGNLEADYNPYLVSAINLSGNFAVTNGQLTVNGATLNAAGGGIIAVSNLVASGPITFNSTGNITATSLELTSGTLGGTNPVTVSGPMTWGSGTLSDTIYANGTLAIAGFPYGNMIINGGLLVNNGTAIWSTGPIGMTGGMISNSASGTFNLTTDTGISGNGILANAGLFRKTGGTNVATISATLTNTGTIESDSGNLALGGGSSTGNFYISSGATISAYQGILNLVSTTVSGPGNLEADYSPNQASAINLNGNFALINGQLTVNGGTLNTSGNGIIAVNNLVANGQVTFNSSGSITATSLNLIGGTLGGTNPVTVSGLMTWSRGTLSDTIYANGTLAMIGNPYDNMAFNGGVLVNNGSATWSAGSVSMTGGIISNSATGTFNMATDAGLYGNGVLANTGLFRKMAGTKTTDIYASFTNSGTVDVESGTLNLDSNHGLAGGALQFGINGLTNFGRINLSGSAALAGGVGAHFNNGYFPVEGNSFAVVTYGSHTGIFTNLNLPSGIAWLMNYGTTAFSLIASNVPPTLSLATGANSGFSLTFIGNTNNSYTVLMATNVMQPAADWSVLGPAVLATNGYFKFLDAGATNVSRFYRVRTP